MSHLGAHIVYRPLEAAHTTIAKASPVTGEEGETIEGSHFHPEMREFAGLVTRERDDGTFDIVIFPPNRAPAHVEGVKEGDGAHEITLSETAAKRPRKSRSKKPAA